MDWTQHLYFTPPLVLRPEHPHLTHLCTLSSQEVHSKIMTNIHRRNAGEVQGIIDPLTGEPVIPLEKEPSLAVEAVISEKGRDTRTDVPAHALGTYLLFFGER